MTINEECLKTFEEIKDMLDTFYYGNDRNMINPCFRQFANEIQELSIITKETIYKINTITKGGK